MINPVNGTRSLQALNKCELGTKLLKILAFSKFRVTKAEQINEDRVARNKLYLIKTTQLLEPLTALKKSPTMRFK